MDRTIIKQARQAEDLRALGVKQSGKRPSWESETYNEGISLFMKLLKNNPKVTISQWGYVVETWYDKGMGLGTRGFYTSTKNSNGNQIGEAQYSYRKDEAAVAHGWAIMTADRRGELMDVVYAEASEWGYEMTRANDEGLADFGEALQAVSERRFDGLPNDSVKNFVIQITKDEE